MAKIVMGFTAGLTLLTSSFAQHDFRSETPDTRDFVLSTESKLVVLDVAVKNRSGYVSGLNADQFKIYEDRTTQAIKQFSAEDAPATIGVVVDLSGSMKPRVDEVVEAAHTFAAASNPEDELFAVVFNDRPWMPLGAQVPFTSNAEVLTESLAKEHATGRTALNDALQMALEHLSRGSRERKALLLISDGGDNQSHLTIDQVLEDFKRSNTTIYAVGIYDADDPDKNPGVLKKLASSTGGAAFFPQKAEELPAICKSIADDIRRRYTLAFTPAVAGNDKGKERKIRVEVSDAAGHKLSVHTRPSYIAE